MTDSSFYIKDPQAVLDYMFDFKGVTNGTVGALSDWLTTSETISSYSVTASALNNVASGSLISIVDDYLAHSNTAVVAWLGGGIEYGEYLITAHIITSSSPVHRIDDRSIKVKIQNR